MPKRAIFLAACCAALAGCATDVVIKPAVNEFVEDSRTASESVTKSYQDLIADTNKATAMMLAANPECGFRIRVMARTRDLDALLRSRRGRAAAAAEARKRGIKTPRVPATTFCLTEFEQAVLNAPAFDNATIMSTPLRVLDASDFKLQLDTVKVLTDYVGALAELADAPKLEAKARIEGVAGDLRSIVTEASGLAGALGVIGQARADTFAAWAKDGGPISEYATAVGALADALENIAKQEQDVRKLRAMLLDPKNEIREKILAIGKEADDWNRHHQLVRQSMVMSSAAGITPELPKMSFEARTEAFGTFLRDYSVVRPSRTSQSPYGAMMVAMADAHDDLQRIARGEYTREEKRTIAAATLKRLGTVLRGIAGIATVFL
jgi:hypothetical protein